MRQSQLCLRDTSVKQLAARWMDSDFLVPRAEGLRVLGCVWNSTLFPGRAPEGHVLLTSFAGGALNPEMCAWSEERIASAVHEDLARVLNINAKPVARHVHIYHARDSAVQPGTWINSCGIEMDMRRDAGTFSGRKLFGRPGDGRVRGTRIPRCGRSRKVFERRRLNFSLWAGDGICAPVEWRDVLRLRESGACLLPFPKSVEPRNAAGDFRQSQQM